MVVEEGASAVIKIILIIRCIKKFKYNTYLILTYYRNLQWKKKRKKRRKIKTENLSVNGIKKTKIAKLKFIIL